MRSQSAIACFAEKWEPVFRQEARQNKSLEPLARFHQNRNGSNGGFGGVETGAQTGVPRSTSARRAQLSRKTQRQSLDVGAVGAGKYQAFAARQRDRQLVVANGPEMARLDQPRHAQPA